jgi:tRNA A-37 threonylcarbamoyl transferase component Bud32
VEHFGHAAMALTGNIAQVSIHKRRQIGAKSVKLGVVHGDVATRNILINDNGNIRIIDFGISTLRASMRDQDWQALLDQEQMEIEGLFIND